MALVWIERWNATPPVAADPEADLFPDCLRWPDLRPSRYVASPPRNPNSKESLTISRFELVRIAAAFSRYADGRASPRVGAAAIPMAYMAAAYGFPR